MTSTDALRAARACILADRTRTLHTCADSNGDIGPHLGAALAEYDAVLAQIDEALASEQEAQPVAWMLKSGHGTQFREGATNPIPGLEWDGKPAWAPVFAAPPSPRYEPMSDFCVNEFAYAMRNKSSVVLIRAIEAEVLRRLGVTP